MSQYKVCHDCPICGGQLKQVSTKYECQDCGMFSKQLTTNSLSYSIGDRVFSEQKDNLKDMPFFVILKRKQLYDITSRLNKLESKFSNIDSEVKQAEDNCANTTTDEIWQRIEEERNYVFNKGE